MASLPLHTQLHKSLLMIQDVISKTAANPADLDEISLRTQHWVWNFQRSLDLSPDVMQICQLYKRLLQEFLVDPLSRKPLNRTLVLCGDGHTYNENSFVTYQLTMPHGAKELAPLNRSKPLSTVTNQIAQEAVKWLTHYSYIPSISSTLFEQGDGEVGPGPDRLEREKAKCENLFRKLHKASCDLQYSVSKEGVSEKNAEIRAAIEVRRLALETQQNTWKMKKKWIKKIQEANRVVPSSSFLPWIAANLNRSTNES
jgi:hypothetical protein